MSAFADFQNEVYLKGLFGEQPTLPFGWRETEAAAHAAMSATAVGYVAGGAGGEDTMAANRAAFDRWRREVLALGGTVLLRERPAEMNAVVDALGPAPTTVSLLRALKERLDPDGRCAPGRLAPWL